MTSTSNSSISFNISNTPKPQRFNLWCCNTQRDLVNNVVRQQIIAWDDSRTLLDEIADELNRTRGASVHIVYLVMPDNFKPMLPLIPDPSLKSVHDA